MDISKRLPLVLLLLRLSVFLVFLMWTLDKFIRPEHAINIYRYFYFINNLTHTTIYVIASIQAVILLGFLIGFAKRFTYGFIFVIHFISTVSTFKLYLMPYTGNNLLFFAAWPMLAACFALYYLRDADTLMTLSRR